MFSLGDVSAAGQVWVVYDGGRGAQSARIRESSESDNLKDMLNVGLWRDKATKDLNLHLPISRALHHGRSTVLNLAFQFSQEWCKFDLEWALFKERWQLDPKPMQDSKCVPQLSRETATGMQLKIGGGIRTVCRSCTCPCTTRSSSQATQAAKPCESVSAACPRLSMP